MTYQRPLKVNLPPEYDNAKNIYSRMAIYFELHFNDNPRNDDLLFQYLYHIVYMLACKAKYFRSFDDYDKFSLYTAQRIYLRAMSQQNSPDDERSINSILNYTKSVLYPMKVDYQKEEFCEYVDPTKTGVDTSSLRIKMEDSVQSEYMSGFSEEVVDLLKTLPKVIKKIVAQTPYKNDRTMSHRLYISIMLSFIKSITFSNANIQKLKRKELKNTTTDTDDTKIELLMKEKETSTTVWNLDNSMSDYVQVLTNKVRAGVRDEIMSIRESYLLSAEDLNAIIMSAYGNVARDDNEEF